MIRGLPAKKVAAMNETLPAASINVTPRRTFFRKLIAQGRNALKIEMLPENRLAVRSVKGGPRLPS
jgi:hypothetical protein